MLLCVVAAYNEEHLLGDCVRSALEAGVDRIHVFDGAWRAGDNGPAFDSATKAASTDGTRQVAVDAGATFHPRRGLWVAQGAKRTAMFQRCGARPGDRILVLDADERITGRFPVELPAGHLNVLLCSIGPNDLPGVRSAFPAGDYSATPRPAFRLFAWSPDLVCVAPGHYVVGGRRVEPYDGLHSRLPLVDEACIEHYANLRGPDRLAAKRAYYAVDHPFRLRHTPAALAALAKQTRGGQMAKKQRIAEKRIYGFDRHGRHVLVAAPGQPIPDGVAVDEGLRKEAPAADHKRSAPRSSHQAKPKPKSRPRRAKRS